MDSFDDFYLKAEVQDEALLIEVTNSPVGETRGATRTPFPVAELVERFKENRPGQGWDSAQAQAFGEALFDALFPAPARELLMRALTRLSPGNRLLLYLTVADAKTAAVPWELAFDKVRQSFLGLDPQVALARVWPSARPDWDGKIKAPLRVLAAFPSPAEQAAVDKESAEAALRDALAMPLQHGRAEFSVIQGPATFERVCKELQTGGYQVLHFVGHVGFDKRTRSGGLYFERPDGSSPDLVNAKKFGQAVGNLKLALVTLVACDSASFAGGESNNSVAAAATMAGVPVVLGTQGPLTQRCAARLAQTFYSALADGLPVGLALADARQALRQANELGRLEWAFPVLYTRPGGRLGAAIQDRRPAGGQCGTDQHRAIGGARDGRDGDREWSGRTGFARHRQRGYWRRGCRRHGRGSGSPGPAPGAAGGPSRQAGVRPARRRPPHRRPEVLHH
jgi:hypothetical protein